MKITFAGLMLLFAAMGAGTPSVEQSTTLPASQAAATQKTTYRRPVQADLLKELIREQEERKPIQPISSGRPGEGATSRPMKGRLIPEGTVLIEKPGRLVYEGQAPMFEFDSVELNGERLKIEILKCGLLEQMELEGKAEPTGFVITAEITAYQTKNYLLLKKVSRRVEHGNVGP